MAPLVNESQSPAPREDGCAIHPDVVRLGVVSLLTDMSSEMIFSVFAVFFTTVAGASAVLLGVIEGLADLSSCSLDYLAGWLADRAGSRKPLALIGYGFSTLAKAMLLIGASVPMLAAFRVVERLGKSFRGPPRDAWISAVAERSVRGYSFGIHKALDKSGAVLGPLLAYGLLSWLGESLPTYRTLFRFAVIPAVLAVAVLAFMPERPGVHHDRHRFLQSWRTLSAGFKRYLVAAGVFSLGYFSFGFLLLRAYDVGFSARDTVLLYALFNAVFVIAAPIAGKLGDLLGRTRVVTASYLIYLLMSLGFAAARSKWHIAALFVAYGIFFSIDEAQSKAFIADVQPERRATAIGAYNFVTGGIYLLASVIAGALWTLGSWLTFAFAASTSAVAILALVSLRPAEH
ncbi:MAG: MFS transporter [Proteobacteria bacterium]|nr:MFS transporter [Pseudomonadota bacterium]